MSKASIITRNVSDLGEVSGNVYQSIVVISKRAKQIATQKKEELSAKLGQFATTVDNLEEVFENKEQIEISKFYEKQPKPATLSINEFVDGETYYRLNIEKEDKF